MTNFLKMIKHNIVKSINKIVVTEKLTTSARLGNTYTKIGMIQRRLAWPLRKDDMQIHEVFHIFRQKYRSMEQNRKPRDKSIYLWTPYL